MPDSSRTRSGWFWVFIAACVLVCVLIVISNSTGNRETADADLGETKRSDTTVEGNGRGSVRHSPDSRRSKSADSQDLSAEEVVAGKLRQFGANHRNLVHALAEHFKYEVPDDVERFFDAVEGGNWEEINAAHEALLLRKDQLNQPRSPELYQIWRPIQEAWGAAREAHNWPPQRLLDYGQAVLGSLRPGMVYVGGTDPGCFIPTFLNETSEGERHVVLTQNALADGSYLDYLNFIYKDRMNALTPDDLQRAFQEYTADAQKRFQHDQQFPDEPKQMRPGEEFHMDENNKISVSGQVAVMTMNEALFQKLMDKNPDASFAIEQSFAFTSIYSNAAPLGPLLELRVQDTGDTLTTEHAAQSVGYWRGISQQLLSDPEAANSAEVRMAYVKAASEQAALFLDRQLTSEAGQTYEIAIQLAASSPKVSDYAKWLIPVVENALKITPENQQYLELLNRLRAAKKN